MEPPSNPIQPPVTPSHPSLFPAISPALSEQTPAPIHSLPPHLRPSIPQPHIVPSRPSSVQPTMEGQQRMHHIQQHQQQQQFQQQQNDENVFGSVMGAPGHVPGHEAPTSAQPKVYASVYSGVPVFEAMIRGISVMRRASDSWVNATQILKVAGVHKSARTKILEKEVLNGIHEKIQGGYGKYQGTWVPLDRGRDLADQYGVGGYLSSIFDFVPSASVIAALPVIRTGTPDRSGQRTPSGLQGHPNQRVLSPFPNHGQAAPHMPPPQFIHQGNEQMMNLPPHPSSLAYPTQPKPYFSIPLQHTVGPQYDERHEGMTMTPTMNMDGLGPPADIARMGFPYNPSDIYIDQYGQPHATYQASPYGKEGGHPSKRQRSDAESGYVENGAAVQQQSEQNEEADDGLDNDSTASDDARDPPPLPSSMLLPHKPIRPKATPANGRIKNRLVQIFNVEGQVNLRSVFGLGPDQLPNFDIDMVIDDQGHSALHWACALARLPIVQQLIELGADIHRGNYAGETPLIRAVLTSNHAEAGSFTDLLQLLSPSIRTLDHAYRTVLHHIALVAGVKGRVPAARTYMASVLEWVAREQQANNTHSITNPPNPTDRDQMAPINLRTLVDVQDVHGDTVLNVAARVGNKGLVNLLLDAGADKTRANKLGLRPENFGLEIEALKVSNGEAVMANLKSEVSKPERKSRDVQKNIATIFESISSTFSTEMLAKQTKLNATEASVRHATRALADKRQHLHRAQEKLATMQLFEQRSENVRRIMDAITAGSLLTPSEFTGRTQTMQEKSTGQLPPLAFRHVPGSALDSSSSQQSQLNGATSSTQLSVEDQEDITLPERDDPECLVKLRRMALWEDRIAEVLEDKIRAMEGEGVDRAVKYRKLVSMCAKVPVDKVDSMLDGLVAAVESEGQGLDFSRASNFVNRIKATKS
ncbi:transcription factor [Cryptococcus gattii Ru294]|nr:transcription factor [Cryptococcus gattii Ru294]